MEALSTARSVVLQPNKKLKVCNAILDLSTWDGPRNNGFISVWMSTGGEPTLLANLNPDVSQAHFEVVIKPNDKPLFYLRSSFGHSNSIVVYLSGHIP